MGDFVPNRNFDQKSTQSPTNWLNSQMSKLCMLAKIDQNSRKKMISSQILDEIFRFLKKILCSMDSSDPEVFKNVLDVLFITSGTDLIWILRKCYGKFKWVWKYSWFWHLTVESVGWTLCWLLISKFLLGTKSPMFGKRMSHRLSVFEKIQSQ